MLGGEKYEWTVFCVLTVKAPASPHLRTPPGRLTKEDLRLQLSQRGSSTAAAGSADVRHQHHAWRCWGHSSTVGRASLVPDPLAGGWLEGICCNGRSCYFCHFHSLLHKLPGKGNSTSKEEEKESITKKFYFCSVSHGATKCMHIISHYAYRKKGSLGEK